MARMDDLIKRARNGLADAIMSSGPARRAAIAAGRLAARAMRAPAVQRAAGIAEAFGGDLPAGLIKRRNFKGATSSHLQMHWKTSGAGANTTVGAAIGTLRNRSRDLLRNNAHASSAVTKLTTRLVGGGIKPRCKSGDAELDVRVNELWEAWAKQASVGDDLTVYGIQELACRSMLESGEVLIRRRYRRPSDQSTGKPLRVPMQIELLEADHLDTLKTQNVPGGGRIVQGVEFDPIGRRRGYWMHPTHPGEQLAPLTSSYASVFVPAESISQLYKPLRPGQVRGVPWLAPVLVTLRDLDEASDYELVRMRMSSALVAFVTLDEENPTALAAPEDGSDGTETITDVNGNPLERVEPGMVAIIRGNKSVTLSTPQAIGGFPDYVASQLARIAAGLNIPYEMLAADLSRVNYSSYRAGALEFRAMVESMQQHLVVPLLCEPMWRWFVTAAIAAGEIPDREYPVVWSPPRIEDIDRVKEATADLIAMRAGTVSRQHTIARMGNDPDQVMAEITADNAAADAAGAVFDSDPRKTSRSGGAQDQFREGAGINPASDSQQSVDAAIVHLIRQVARGYAAEGDEEGAESMSLAADLLSS